LWFFLRTPDCFATNQCLSITINLSAKCYCLYEMLSLLFEKAWKNGGERGTRSANISVNSASYKSIGATVMPSPRSRSCQKFSSPRKVNYCPIPLQETSVSRTLADGLYFSAQASPRCNLYLITAGNILDLKSFLVKYRNIKETSGAPPQGERASGRRKWFTFHEFFTATWTTRKPPKLQPLEPSFSLPLVSFCLFLLPSFDPLRSRSLP